MPTRRRKTTRKKATSVKRRRRAVVVKPIRRKRRRRIKQGFSVTFKDVAMLGAGAVAGTLAAKMIKEKAGKLTEKLPMSDKVNYGAVAVAVAGTLIASKSKTTTKLIGLGMGASGVASVVTGFINKGAEEPKKVEAEFSDVQAELLGMGSVQRVADDYSDYSGLYIEGVQRVADDLENYVPDEYEFRTY